MGARCLQPTVVAIALAVLCGCGHEAKPVSLPTTAPGVGPGPRFRPPSLSRRAAQAKPIAGLRCAHGDPTPRYGVHLEVFAHGKVVLIPPGIGIAPPRRTRGAYVSGGRCSYPLRTREPTGVIEVQARRPTMTLGQFFAVWGQRPRGRAYVNGRRWTRDPRSIPLERHAEIVLEVSGYVRPHASYRFPPGL